MVLKNNKSKLKIGLIDIFLNEKESYVERVDNVFKILSKTNTGEFDLIVLPELWIVGAFDYLANTQLNQKYIKNVLLQFSKIAASKKMYIHSGTHPILNSRNYLSNTAIIFNPNGKQICSYEKIHLFGFTNGEKKVFKSGKSIKIFDLFETKVGVSTCYDLRFPEIFIKQVNLGAKILVVSAAWPQKRIKHWKHLLIARAIESQCYVVASNTSGISANVQLGSNSMVIDPTGNEIKLKQNRNIFNCDIDLGKLNKYRSGFPVLADRKRTIQ